MMPPALVRSLLPLLCLLLASCRDGGTALSVAVKLKGPAGCIRITAAAPGGQSLSSDIPVDAGEDFRARTFSAAIYPGGALGAGAVSLQAQAFAGSCGGSAATQEARQATRFVQGKVTPVLLALQLLAEDTDGDGFPNGDDCAPADPARFPRAGPESGAACSDGVDDDCDGAADDGCPCTTPRPCYPASFAAAGGVGACTRGTQACSDGAWGDCNGYVLPVDDLCDGVDNDCNGTVDDGCPCTDGDTRPCYEAGPAGLAGVGGCGRGVQSCASDAWGECLGDVAPAAETCNGLDDDCDGTVDELPDVATPPCSQQQGVCAGSRLACGQPSCTQAGYSAHAAANDAGYAPQEGAAHCDGLDNDCDGLVDEGCPCPAGAEEACHPLGLAYPGLGQGNCKAGVRTCQADGGWGECAGAVAPVPEACNGLDDDCDGTEDNAPADAGQPCDSGAKGLCTAGTWLCSGGGLVCVADVAPAAERCDGLDNDCDGNTDEDFPGVGQSCNPGVGACARTGTIQCLPDGGAGCSVDAGQPSPDVCNGLDDDCDGKADQDYGSVGTLCSLSFGTCVNNGTITCLPDGGAGCSASTPVPAAETCNGLDDDCDGTADEDFPSLGQSCSNGLLGTCAAQGKVACAPGGVAACNAPLVQPGTESCNGLDDDCDGTVDDGLGLGTPCSRGVGACTRSGTVACNPDGTAGCNAPTVAGTPETCNGADDNCDGAVDDGFNVGQPCTVGVGACARAGTWACNAQGGATCVYPGGAPVTAGPSSREVCDTLDNDCDGAADEQPACGGPRADVAENAATTWAYSDANSDVPNYCGTTALRGSGSMATSGAVENVTTGSTSARVIYTYSYYFQARYPGANNGNWDLSTTSGLHFNVKHLPMQAGVTWEFNGPLVVLCGAPGTYRVLRPTTQHMTTSFRFLDVPLNGQAGAWSVTTVGNFSLSQVNSVEFHADPFGNTGGSTINVYFDDVRFY